jgi:hypothetical protein
LERIENYWVLGLEREECLERKKNWRKTYVLGDEIIKSLVIWDDTSIKRLERWIMESLIHLHD